MQENKEKHLQPSLKAALKNVEEEDRIVFYTSDIAIGGAKRNNPTAFPPVSIFGRVATEYTNVIITKNSPLKPILMTSATKSFERGQYERVAAYWQGNLKEKVSTSTDLKILTSGQVFMIFGFLMFAMGAATFFLLIEKLHLKYQRELKARNLNLFRIKRPQTFGSEDSKIIGNEKSMSG